MKVRGVLLSKWRLGAFNAQRIRNAFGPEWYFSGMRVKTSVTLPSSLLKEIDRQNNNRSAFLEHAARFYLAQTAKKVRESKDSAILEKHSERLNREAEDVLDYQALPE